MDCSCRSKELYKQFDKLTFNIDKQQLTQARTINRQPKIEHNHSQQQSQQLLKSIYASSQIYLPITIDKISIQQIYTNPLWFYKNYIALNKPCILADGYQGQILDTWSHPKQFVSACDNAQIGDISVSVTPDGFADSIKNQYFIQPLEVKAGIKDIVNWGEGRNCGQLQKKEDTCLRQQWIPYVQHQNSNLTKQLNNMTQLIDQQFKQFVSCQYFSGQQPDAANFWMGYRDSVSAIHKDPYENFYTTIVGQKHFTLLPPVSIAYLQQQSYKSAKWKIDQQSNKLVAHTSTSSAYQTTRWICNNPDLKSDWSLFPELENLRDSCHHVVLKAGQTLYLPSLWYHQVSQTHKQSPYTIAINYWFDMSFNHNYSLYQAIRKIKNYP